MTRTLAPAIPLPRLTRVAVVGAGGPSGLVAVRQLLDAGVAPSQIAAFEARSVAGGVWNYEAQPGDMVVDWRHDGPPVVRSKREVENVGANGPSGEQAEWPVVKLVDSQRCMTACAPTSPTRCE